MRVSVSGMRLLVALLLCLHLAAGPALAGLVDGDCTDERTSASAGTCVPGCPDEDGGAACFDSCQHCVCCPAVAPLPAAPVIASLPSPSTRPTPSPAAELPHRPASDVFHPPRVS